MIYSSIKKKINFELWYQLHRKYNMAPNEIIIVSFDQIKPFKNLRNLRGLYIPLKNYDKILLIDHCETPLSLTWLYFHEFRHMYINHNKQLCDILTERDNLIVKKMKKISDNDLIMMPSEVDADMFATTELGRYYGDQWHYNRIMKESKKSRSKK